MIQNRINLLQSHILSYYTRMMAPNPILSLSFITLIIPLVFGCGLNHVAVDPPIQIAPPAASGRLLQQQVPHPIRIVGEFVLPTATPNLSKLIQTVFNISSNYYSRIITTTTTLISDLPITAVSACNMTLQTIPARYLNLGFNTSTTDLVVFVQLLPDTTGDYVALATACVSVRRPIYGYMNINPPEFQQTTISNFQSSLQIIIHQTAHILGFGRIYFNSFYVSPTSLQTLPITSVLRNISGRTYVVSPNVLKFVQKYFNCSDNLTGGLLENQGTPSTALNHWERVVYYNELMTSSALPIGMRFSALSLALLKDTNYYSNVDLSQAQQIFWGHQKGCHFARSLSISPPQFCNLTNSPRVACDFYSDSISFCASQYDIFAQGSAFYVPYSNGICNNISSGRNNTSANDYLNIRYTSSSKCLYARQERGSESPIEASTCYQSECMVNGSIRISVGDTYDNCIYPGQKLVFGDITVSCPINFQIFCSGKSCLNSCNNRGFCMRGSCICMAPYRGTYCQITCERYQDNVTKLCVNECASNQYIFNPNICVSRCPQNYTANEMKVCEYCDERCKQSLGSLTRVI